MGKFREAKLSKTIFVFVFYIYHCDITERTIRTTEFSQAPDSLHFIYKLFELDLFTLMYIWVTGSSVKINK